MDKKVELPEAEATVARLTTLVDTPRLDEVDPTADEIFVLARDEVEEAPIHTCCRRYEAIV